MVGSLRFLAKSILLWLFLACRVGFAARDPWQMNMFHGVTPLSHDIYFLHMTAIAVCAVIGLIVFGVMIYALIHHRKSKGHEAVLFHENLRLEIFWTIIPFLILVALAIPATTVLIRLEDTSESDVTIKVVGYQWKWQYQYLNEGISFFSSLATPYPQINNQQPKDQWYLLDVDNPLVVPINKKIRFLVTSNDVVHSWWVPQLGVKRDAIPGFMHEAWAIIEKPGVYRGQCAELCGINHGFMPIVVRAVSSEDYDAWVAKAEKVVDPYAEANNSSIPKPPLTRAQLMTQGKAKYEQVCSACHGINGKGLPPLYPALQRSSVAVGYPIDRHTHIVLDGVPGTAMQAYRDQLTDEEMAGIITYERNAWGNNTNDLVQPSDITAVRTREKVEPKLVDKVNKGGLR